MRGTRRKRRGCIACFRTLRGRAPFGCGLLQRMCSTAWRACPRRCRCELSGLFYRTCADACNAIDCYQSAGLLSLLLFNDSRPALATMHSTYAVMLGVQVDSVAALTNAVDLIMSRDPPTRLDAFGALLPNPAADTPPASPTSSAAAAAEAPDPFAHSDLISPASPDAAPSIAPSAALAAPATALHPPVSDGWIFHALGTFCLSLVDAPDAAVAAEAARALLHLKWLHATLQFPRLQVATVPEQWARTAMSALFRIGDPADAVAAREAVTQIICRCAKQLRRKCLSCHEVP